MVLHQSAWTGSVANAVLQAQDARLAMTGLLAINGPTPLDVRPGIIYTTGLPLNVTGNSSTSPWQYVVAAGSYVSTKGNTDGPHVGTNDGVVLVATTVPPGSNSRYDLIYAQQQDADATISPDGSTVPVLGVVNGTPGASPAVPATPAGATVLATALVASTASGGTSGAGVTINTGASRYTTLRGGHIPCRSQAERDEMTVRDGLQVYRLDKNLVETYNGTLALWFGGAWQSWTPTLTGITLGNGTLTCAYTVTGKSLTLRVVISFGSTTVITGNTSLTLPPALTTAAAQQNLFCKIHPGAQQLVGFANLTPSATSMSLWQPTSNVNATLVQVGSIAYTYGAGSDITITGTLEIA